MISFGKRLRELREERGLTQRELAGLLNLNQSTIAFYETDKKQPSQDTLARLADLFDVSVDYLLGRTDIRNPVKSLPLWFQKLPEHVRARLVESNIDFDGLFRITDKMAAADLSIEALEAIVEAQLAYFRLKAAKEAQGTRRKHEPPDKRS